VAGLSLPQFLAPQSSHGLTYVFGRRGDAGHARGRKASLRVSLQQVVDEADVDPLLQFMPSSGDIMLMDSAEEVLEAVERHLPRFTTWHSMAALRVLSKMGVSEPAASSEAMAKLITFHDHVLRRDDPPDFTQLITSTTVCCSKLVDQVPKVERLAVTASYVAYRRIRDLRPADVSLLTQFPAFQTENFLRHVASAVQRRMRMYSPAMLANVTVGYAKAKVRDSAFLQDVGDMFVNKLDIALPWNVARMVQAYAMLGERHDELLESSASYAAENIGRFQVYELNSLAWGFAKLGVGNKALGNALAQAVSWRLSELSPGELSTMVWSLVVHKLQGTTINAFTPRAAKAIVRDIADYYPAAISRVVWSFAALNASEPELLEAAADRARAMLNEFTPIGVANMVWGFATLKYKDPELMAGLARQALGGLEAYSAQDISNLAWSFATLEISHPELFEAIAEQVVKRISEFSQQGLDMVVWAFDSMQLGNEQLMQAVSEHAKQHEETLRPAAAEDAEGPERVPVAAGAGGRLRSP